MVQSIISFSDAKGKLHATANLAAVSDLSELFGSAEGMSTGIANTILKKRKQIERIFAELDIACEWNMGR